MNRMTEWQNLTLEHLLNETNAVYMKKTRLKSFCLHLCSFLACMDICNYQYICNSHMKDHNNSIWDNNHNHARTDHSCTTREYCCKLSRHGGNRLNNISDEDIRYNHAPRHRFPFLWKQSYRLPE